MTTELQAAAAAAVEIEHDELPSELSAVEAVASVIDKDGNDSGVIWLDFTKATRFVQQLESLGFSIVRTSTLRNSRNGVYDTRTDKDVD